MLDNPKLLQAMGEKPGLAGPWKKLEDLAESGDDAFKALKQDPDFLKKFDDVVKNDGLNKHVFEGDVKIVGKNEAGDPIYKITGIHSKEAFADGTARIKPGTQIEELGDLVTMKGNLGKFKKINQHFPQQLECNKNSKGSYSSCTK